MAAWAMQFTPWVYILLQQRTSNSLCFEEKLRTLGKRKHATADKNRKYQTPGLSKIIYQSSLLTVPKCLVGRVDKIGKVGIGNNETCPNQTLIHMLITCSVSTSFFNFFFLSDGMKNPIRDLFSVNTVSCMADTKCQATDKYLSILSLLPNIIFFRCKRMRRHSGLNVRAIAARTNLVKRCPKSQDKLL